MPFPQRIHQLQEVIRDRRLAGAILFYSRDILYYTGTAQPAYLVVLPDDYTLFVRRGYHFARREAGLEAGRIVPESDLAPIARRMFPHLGAGAQLGTELDLLTVPHARTLGTALGGPELIDISPAVLSQRAIKDAGEIASIKKACAAVHAGHLAALSTLRPGIAELDLAASVEHAQRLAGHEGVFFIRLPDFTMSRGPLASGPNLRRISGMVYTISGTGLSSAVPAGPSRRVLERGDLVVVDIPACIDGYHADQSRTYAVGAAPPSAADLYRRLRAVADHVIQHMRPGVSCGEVYALAETRAAELGVADPFLALDYGPKPFFVGHGIGLELNEPPLLSRESDVILRSGMVFALELHLMEPEGHTVKLEDTVHITPEGAEPLTLTPRDLIVV